jgi:hypothetical protein
MTAPPSFSAQVGVKHLVFGLAAEHQRRDRDHHQDGNADAQAQALRAVHAGQLLGEGRASDRYFGNGCRHHAFQVYSRSMGGPGMGSIIRGSPRHVGPISRHFGRQFAISVERTRS